MGKAPIDLGGGLGGLITVVAAHPKHDVVAAGYQDGTTILVQIDRPHSVLVKRAGEGCSRSPGRRTDSISRLARRADISGGWSF